MKKATPRDVQYAHAFLKNRGYTKQMIPPIIFANTAKTLGKSFNETIKILIHYLQGDQGEGQSPIAKRLAGDDM